MPNEPNVEAQLQKEYRRDVARAERLSRKIAAEERKLRAEMYALMKTGLSFEEAWVATGGMIVSTPPLRNAMQNELSVEEIVCAAEYRGLTIREQDILIADWRKRGDALTLAQADYEAVLNSYVAENQRLSDRAEIAEKELEALSASHKDLAHRLARMGEALKAARPFVQANYDQTALTNLQLEGIAQYLCRKIDALVAPKP